MALTGKHVARALAMALGMAVACSTLGADLPKRKSGLWGMKNQMEGAPTNGTIQMCIDQTTDNLMQQRAKEKQNCSVMDVNRSSGKVTIHAVCQFEDTTATTDAVITGDFETSYRNDMRIRYSPPKHGMGEMHMIQEAKWLGPCKAGQKPGDIIMPGMPAMNAGNMQEMMKDPKFREMLRQQSQRQAQE